VPQFLSGLRGAGVTFLAYFLFCLGSGRWKLSSSSLPAMSFMNIITFYQACFHSLPPSHSFCLWFSFTLVLLFACFAAELNFYILFDYFNVTKPLFGHLWQLDCWKFVPIPVTQEELNNFPEFDVWGRNNILVNAVSEADVGLLGLGIGRRLVCLRFNWQSSGLWD
jgi:hypothetical protein